MLIGLHGYIGRGNFGDRAMSEALVAKLASWGHDVLVFAFDSEASDVAALRALGAHVVSDKDRFKVRDCDRFVVGGGELGPGFGAQLVYEATFHGVPVAAYGQSYGEVWLNAPNAAEQYLGLHACVAPRDRNSVQRLIRLGVRPYQGCDPALAWGSVAAKDPSKALLFVRKPSQGYNDYRVRKLAADMLQSIRVAGLEPTVVASSATDVEIAADTTGLPVRLPVSVQDLVDEVASSSLVCSVGRYHPILFAHRFNVKFSAYTIREVPDELFQPYDPGRLVLADAILREFLQW